MRKPTCIFAFLFLIVFGACDNKDGSDSFLIDPPQSYQATIQQGIEKGESWTSNPISIVNHLFLNKDDENYVVMEYKPLAADSVLVIITEEGLQDDATYGEKRIITFKKMHTHWQIEAIKWGCKCQENRGHTNYSGNICS